MAKLYGALCRAALALGTVTLLSAAAASPQGKARLTALAQLQPGLWQLRDLEHKDAPPRSICLADPNRLMQIRHPDSPCSRLVIANDRAGATVHYTCPAGGFGRTSLKVETPRLATIDTQGISDNAPFALRAEARRLGPCR